MSVFCTSNMCECRVTSGDGGPQQTSGECVRAKRHVSISPDWISSVQKYSNLVNTYCTHHIASSRDTRAESWPGTREKIMIITISFAHSIPHLH